MTLPVGPAHHLGSHLPAGGVGHGILTSVGADADVGHCIDREALIIIYYNRRAAALGVEQACHSAHGRGQHIGEAVEREQLVVPGKLIGLGNAGARQVVVKLVPNHAAPVVGHLAHRVGLLSEILRNDRCPLSGVAQMLVLPVVQLHGRLRGVAARAVYVHRHFSVSDRQLGMLVKRKIVLVYLVAGGADDFDRAIAVYAFFHGTHRLHRRRASRVAGTIITVYRAERALAQLTLEQAAV